MDYNKKASWEVSLNEVIASGATVADVFGYFTTECGEATFKLTRLVLNDGNTINVEGEHDFPYLTHNVGVLNIPESLDDV
jgi:hypothetical protein